MAHKPGRCRLHFIYPIPRLPPTPFSCNPPSLPAPPTPPSHPSMLSVGWALSLNSPLQWQAVSPSEKTPDLKRALRTLLSKMKVMSTAAMTAPNTQLRAQCHWICPHMQNTPYLKADSSMQYIENAHVLPQKSRRPTAPRCTISAVSHQQLLMVCPIFYRSISCTISLSLISSVLLFLDADGMVQCCCCRCCQFAYGFPANHRACALP